MNIPDGNCRYQPPPPPHRRKTPSFSSSLLDSILRSIDETNDGGGLRDVNLQVQVHDHDHDHDLMFFANSQPKRSSTIHLINEPKQIPSLRRAIMIDQWMETHNNNKSNPNYGQASRKFSSDSNSSSGTTTTTTTTTTFSETTETPSTYRSLPNSFTISRNTVFLDHTPNKREGKFMKSTKLRAMKIYGDLKKVKQPISPGSRISAFIYSLFAPSSSSSSSKKTTTKAKIEESMQNFRSLKKSRSTKQDASSTMTCTSFSRSCMSKKQRSSGVKRSVRFYPENDAVILDRKSVHERDADSTTLPKYERRWFAEKNYTRNYRNFRVNVEEDDEDVYEDEDEDDLFELEIVGGVGTCSYRQELPVFETTDLRKIRI